MEFFRRHTKTFVWLLIICFLVFAIVPSAMFVVAPGR
jgi:hypothetical protein